MSKRKKNPYLELTDSEVAGFTTFNYYYDRLKEIAYSRFKWNGLPSSVNEWFLEKAIQETGQAVFFIDEVVNIYQGLKVAMTGPLDNYGIPIEREAYADNGYHAKLDAGNSVVIFNNYLRRPSLGPLYLFAQKLASVDRAVIINTNAQKTPVVLLCDEGERLTMKNVFKQYTGDEPVIYATKQFNIENIKALKTDAPFVADKLMGLKREYWEEALKYLGIETSNTKKAERLITDEVEAGLGEAYAQRNNWLKMREFACKQINEMFGLSVSVEFSESPTLTNIEEVEEIE